MGDFSKHIDVLGFRQGKLSVLWQQNVELDISNPQIVLRVLPEPVADVDGDGHDEVVASVFNQKADQRWHTMAYDALTGAVRSDLPDQQVMAQLDLDGDGVAELLTTESSGAAAPEFGTIAVWSLRDRTAKRLWSLDQAAWQTHDAPLPDHVKSSATFGRRTVLRRKLGSEWAVVVRRKQAADCILSVRAWRGGALVERWTVRGAEVQATGIDGNGRLLVLAQHAPQSNRSVMAGGARLIRGETRPLGVSPGPVTVAWPENGKGRSLAVQGTGEELVVLAPLTDGQPSAEPRRIHGRGQSTQWPEARGPVLADLDGDGRRQVLYATATAKGSAQLVAADLGGSHLWHHEWTNIPGGAPVWNVGGLILWQTGHFTDPRRLDVLVTVRRSMMHSEETCLLSGQDGHEIWRRARQVSHRGVGGTPFAIADFNGDGLDDACSLHPSILYILHGKTGRDLLARDATWDSVPAKPVYWGLPAAGPFTAGSVPSIFFGGRSMTGLVNADGTLAWFDALDHAAPSWPAFGVFGTDRRMEAIGFGYEDGVRCYDLGSGNVRWRMGQSPSGECSGNASADVDGDGQDEAVFVIGRKLVCLGEASGQGTVKWVLDLPTECGPPTLAVLETAGPLSVLLAGADGCVYCIR
jgi:hypothetical protein